MSHKNLAILALLAAGASLYAGFEDGSIWCMGLFCINLALGVINLKLSKEEDD